MKTPKYTLSNLLLKYIVKYETSIKDLEHTDLPKDLKKPLIEKLYAEDIDNLSQLVAFPIGYNTALKILRGQEHTTGKSKKKVFAGFRNAKEYIKKYNSKTALKPSMELAIHLNKLVTKGWNDEWDQGRIKDFSEKPNTLYDTWYELRDYYPSTDMKEYFNDLFRWITGAQDNTHKLVQFGVLVYEMIDKAPFFAGNQITTILLLELMAKLYGYNPNIVLPFSKSFNFISEDLKSAYRISKGKNDLTTFIEAYLYTTSLTTIETTREFTQIYKEKILKYPKMTEELNSRQIKIVDYLDTNKKASRQELTDMIGVSFMTIYRDLQELMEKDYVVQRGKGRGTHYKLKEDERGVEIKEEKLPVFGEQEPAIQVF
jgi:Fic family protein